MPITNLSGTIANSSALKIQGAGFGVKANSPPLLWDLVSNQPTYRNLTEGDLIPTNGLNPWQERTNIKITRDRQHRGNRTAHYYGIGAESPSNERTYLSWPRALGQLPSPKGAEVIYCSWWYKTNMAPDFYNGVGGSGTQKFMRIWDRYNGSGTRISWTQQHMTHPSIGGGGLDDGHYDPLQPAAWNGYVDRWNHMEMWASGNRIQCRINNGIIQDVTDFLKDPNAVEGLNVWVLGFDPTPADPPDFRAKVTELSDIYIDNTLSRVEIGDAPIYGDCTHKEVQIASSWTDSDIEITLDQGALRNFHSNYLFVIDENGVPSKGYRLMEIKITPELKADFELIDTTYHGRRNHLAVEIGDSKQPEFVPQIKFSAWSNEANFSIRALDSHVDISEVGGRLKFDTVLPRKPLSNAFQFSIRSKEVDFFYQPELTPEEIAEGFVRPDDVIGSYAVYGRKRNNKYKAGKICHIYRPYIEDALGAKEWCVMDIVGDVLTLTIPQQFLDTATYPLILDPDFGYTTGGASQANLVGAYARADIHADTLYTASTGDTIVSYSVYGDTPSGTNDVSLTAYDMSGSTPNNRLAAGTDVSLPTSTGWVTTGAVSQSLTNAVQYCVALADGATGTGNKYCKYDSGAPLPAGDRDSRNTGGTFNDPWTENYKTNLQYSIYATYTTGGGGATGKSNPLSGPLGGPLQGMLG